MTVNRWVIAIIYWEFWMVHHISFEHEQMLHGRIQATWNIHRTLNQDHFRNSEHSACISRFCNTQDCPISQWIWTHLSASVKISWTISLPKAILITLFTSSDAYYTSGPDTLAQRFLNADQNESGTRLGGREPPFASWCADTRMPTSPWCWIKIIVDLDFISTFLAYRRSFQQASSLKVSSSQLDIDH